MESHKNPDGTHPVDNALYQKEILPFTQWLWDKVLHEIKDDRTFENEPKKVLDVFNDLAEKIDESENLKNILGDKSENTNAIMLDIVKSLNTLYEPNAKTYNKLLDYSHSWPYIPIRIQRKERDKEENDKKKDFIELVKEIVGYYAFWHEQGEGILGAMWEGPGGKRTPTTVKSIGSVLKQWNQANPKSNDDTYDHLRTLVKNKVKNDGSNKDKLYKGLRDEDYDQLNELKSTILAWNTQKSEQSSIPLSKTKSTKPRASSDEG